MEKGFNQLYLGTLAGVSEDFISQVERGINQPSFETIEALAAALKIEIKTLFDFPANVEPPTKLRRTPSTMLNTSNSPRLAAISSLEQAVAAVVSTDEAVGLLSVLELESVAAFEN